MERVAIKAKLLRWAYELAGLEAGDLERKFPRSVAWEAGETQPTPKQVEAFAKATFRDEIEDGMVKPFDPVQGKKYVKYLPFWA